MAFEANDNLTETANAITTASGCDHVTLLTIEDGGQRLRRIYSSVPDVFPVHGAKVPPMGGWLEKLAGSQAPVLVAGPDEIKSVFQDHETIFGLEIDTILNVPVIRDGECVGTVNCLYRDRLDSEAAQSIAKAISSVLAETPNT